MTELPEPPSPPARTRDSRRSASPLARIGMMLFTVGILAVAVILVLFATGGSELPLWLNLTAMLAPLGFGVGLIGVFLEARSSPARSVARDAGRPTTPSAHVDRVEHPA